MMAIMPNKNNRDSMIKKVLLSQKTLLISVVLVFLCSTNSAIKAGHAPGAEEWKDQSGRFAPARVRQAADKLWNSVEEEGGAALNAGWGVQKEMRCGPNRCFVGILLCGLPELWYMCLRSQGRYDNFGQSSLSRPMTSRLAFEQKTRELKEALAEFKNVVNGCVSRPEQYSGDADICTLGPWVEDGAWSLDEGSLVSARRDMSGVARSTMIFVNMHGGWVSN